MDKLDQHENHMKQKRLSPGRIALKLFQYLIWIGCFAFLTAVLSGAGLFYHLSRDLPHIATLRDYRPPTITTVLADDGTKIGEFYNERRRVIPLSDMPDTLIQAFIAAEDARFYSHRGIDIISIIRAFFKNLEAGAIVQGGSTITQQVTKSFFLTPEKSYKRKIKEAILAYRLDKNFAKEDILYLYLNQIYLGHGAYGVEAAAENYFAKPASELNLSECAILAGLPQAPSRYSPFHYPERARQRQHYVLNRMVAEGVISQADADAAKVYPLDIQPRRNWYIEKVPCYTEHVRRYVEAKYGKELLYNGGLQIHTAVNIDMQRSARAEISDGLRAIDKRQGYRGPLRRLAKADIEAFCEERRKAQAQTPLAPGMSTRGVVIDVSDRKARVTVRLGNARGTISLTTMKWARKPDPEHASWEQPVRRPGQVLKTGDVVLVKLIRQDPDSGVWELHLDQEPAVQSALLCMEAETGHVKAMIGGRDFMNSQFNRAIQSRRQPGSAFKPVIFAAALDKGYTPASVIIDSPIIFEDAAHDFTWKPQNYEKTFYGPTLLREALIHSRNIVTVKVLKDIGIDYAIRYADTLGIHSELKRDLSIALGSSGISLLEIVQAYSVFCNMGFRIEPVFITGILDRDGNVLERNDPLKKKVMEMSTAFIITHMLEDVVKRGTGKRVRALKRPAAGKTGTTNNLFDAWFVGYTPRFITGVWVGFDEEASLGKYETGSKAASPIWLGFMKKILEGKPPRVFQVPEGVVFKKIDAETGLLPIAASKKTVFECFKEGTEPTTYTPQPETGFEDEAFFKTEMY